MELPHNATGGRWSCSPLPGIPVNFSPGHGHRNPVGYGPHSGKESDMTDRLHFHFSLSCIGEGNGNPLQCSCLENPKDSGAWWAAIYGIAQSRTRLKWLSSSSSMLGEKGKKVGNCVQVRLNIYFLFYGSRWCKSSFKLDETHVLLIKWFL